MGVWLDDEFPEHPKVEALGDDLAAWLYIAGLCYANRNLTGGRIPKHAALRLTNKASPKLIARLLASLVPGKGPLWEDHGDHYRIHDYDQHQQSAEKRRAEIEDAKQKRSEHARRAAMARHHSHDGQGAEHVLSRDRASPEHPPGTGPAEGGAPPDDAQALARASAGARSARGRPNALVPTHRSSSSLDGVGDANAEEEEDSGVATPEHVARLVAERRYAKLSDPPPEGFRKGSWLTTTAASVLADGADEDIRDLLAKGRPVPDIVDLYEPPAKPTQPPEPMPSREHLPSPFDQVWDEETQTFRTVRVSA